MDILKGIRPSDYVLTAAMVALAALLGVANITMGADEDLAHALDSQSPLLVPVFMAAALPVLWRRRSVLAAIGASFVVVAASVPAFGWVTRCGFALPLSIAMAYAVARFAGSRQNHLIGLVGIFALQVVTLVRDASTGGLARSHSRCRWPPSPTASAASCRTGPTRTSSALRCRPSTSTRDGVGQ